MPCNTSYKGKWLMNEQLTLADQKQDIVGLRVKTKLQKCTLQIYKWAILSGEEFMVLEKLVGEKFMIPCKNIPPCVFVPSSRPPTTLQSMMNAKLSLQNF